MVDPQATTFPEDLATRDYDLTSRHVLVARAVQLLAPEGRVLDVGGSLGLTGQLLPGHRAFAIDIRDPQTDVLGSGDRLPFRDNSFAAVTVLDVLEHVPPELRSALLREAARVADVVVVAGPCNEPAVVEAERQQRELFEAMFGEAHPWLTEHAECGLPAVDELVDVLGSCGMRAARFGSNPVPMWSRLLFNTHIALRTGFDADTAPVRRFLLEEFLADGDGTQPSYRQIIIAARHGDPETVAAAIAPSSNPDAVERACFAIDVSTARVVATTMQTTDHYRAELAAGWEEAAGQARGFEDDLRHMNALVSATDVTLAAIEAQFAADRLTPERLRLGAPAMVVPEDAPDDAAAYQHWIANRPEPGPAPEHPPLISVVVPVFNPRAAHLEACIRSVRRQTLEHWELVLVHASTAEHVDPICRRFATLDPRITVVRQGNAGIAGNTNAGIDAAKGEWIAFLDHDDELAPHALADVARHILAHPEVDFVYSDEDKISDEGTRSEPFFKPGWSPDLLRTLNYIGHFVCVRATLARSVRLRPGFEGAQDYDFNLRATARARRVDHIPDVLYHWRAHATSTAADVRVKPAAHSAGRRALQDFLTTASAGAWVDAGPGLTSHRARYPLPPTTVSIIIPFRDAAAITDRCLRSIFDLPPSLPIEILLVSNQSTHPETIAMMDRWSQSHSALRAVSWDEPFNFQALNNWAVRQCSGPLVLFLNNDTYAVHPGWLEAMAEQALRPEVGAVGARLFYPDGRIQHAGVAVGIGGLAEHPWARRSPDAFGPAGPSYWVRNFLAVTAACLMIERTTFEEVGGFDERFVVCGGDVDLGLRLHQRGYWNVMTPFAWLVHDESATRDRQPPQIDVDESLRSYAPYLAGGDPFYNPNLTRADTTCGIAVAGVHGPAPDALARPAPTPNRGSASATV